MSKITAKILLLSVFIARGTSFLFAKSLLAVMMPLNILAVRFITAFAILLLIFNKKIISCSRKSIEGGIALGAMYTLCMICEMYSMKTVDSGVIAFIENMAIVLVPMYVAVYTRKLPKGKLMISAAIAVAGVGFLSLSQRSVGLNAGVILAVMGAVCYGFCILLTQKYSEEAEPLAVGIFQLGFMGVFSLIISFAIEDFRLPKGGMEWWMILMLVLICSCFGFTFQPMAQKSLSAETAAVFTVVNPLTATILGVFIMKEGISISKAVGSVLILLSLFLYNFDGRKKNYTLSKELSGK